MKNKEKLKPNSHLNCFEWHYFRDNQGGTTQFGKVFFDEKKNRNYASKPQSLWCWIFFYYFRSTRCVFIFIQFLTIKCLKRFPFYFQKKHLEMKTFVENSIKNVFVRWKSLKIPDMILKIELNNISRIGAWGFRDICREFNHELER